MSLYLIIHHKIKIWGNASTALFLSQHQMEVSGQLHAPCASPLRKEPPAAHSRGGCIHHRASLDTVKECYVIPTGNKILTPQLSSMEPSNYTDKAIPGEMWTDIL